MLGCAPEFICQAITFYLRVLWRRGLVAEILVYPVLRLMKACFLRQLENREKLFNAELFRAFAIQTVKELSLRLRDRHVRPQFRGDHLSPAGCLYSGATNVENVLVEERGLGHPHRPKDSEVFGKPISSKKYIKLSMDMLSPPLLAEDAMDIFDTVIPRSHDGDIRHFVGANISAPRHHVSRSAALIPKPTIAPNTPPLKERHMPLNPTISSGMPLRNKLMDWTIGVRSVTSHGPIVIHGAAVSAEAKRLADQISSFKIAACHLALALLLAGCATAAERAQWQAEAAIDRQAPYCERLGYARNTDPWRRCIAEREQARDASNRMCTWVYGNFICQ